MFQIDHSPRPSRSYSHSVGRARSRENVARGTSASLLLDLPHARYHNHLINLLLLLRILAHDDCVCVRRTRLPPSCVAALSTDFFISSSRSACTDFTTSLSFLPLRLQPRHRAGVITASSCALRVINDPTCVMFDHLWVNSVARIELVAAHD